MADSNITFSTSLDNSNLEKALARVEKNLESLRKKLEDQQFEQSWLEKMMDRAGAKADEAKVKVDELREQIKELESEQSAIDTDDMDPASIERWRELGSQIMGTYERLKAAQGEYDASLSEWEGYSKKWDIATAKAQSYEKAIEVAEKRQRKLSEQVVETTKDAEELQRSSSQIGSAMASGMDSASAMLDRFTSRLNSMLKQALIFGVIMKGINAIKKGIAGALLENERFSASWEGLKATIAGVANGIARMVAPALSAVVNAVSSAIMTIASTVDSLLGTHFAEAIREARSAAEATWRQGDASQDAADATRDQADAVKDLAKEEKKAAKSILAFDELNVMQSKNAEDAADAMGDEADAVPDAASDAAAQKPDWGALDVGKIDAKLSEIMLVLGAALMAVGAILAFSGINIPVGLTLMVIGALMVYAAYKENWSKLPQKVRDAITAALVITGIVLVTLGAVLAFSGVNVPLGIGMMVAGALLLWTAVALNWEGMSAQVRAVVTVLMAALSVALLVIGAILTFSGANVPLGIALMVVGAMSLAAVAAINWGDMPEQVRVVVSVIMAILGGALLVIGAILALTGVSVPLGVGLMLVGAVLLGADAALNWDSMPEHMRAVVAVIGAILSVVLLVIGAILAFSGASVPLGIALMAVGAIGLAADVIVNWDAITQRFDEVLPLIEAAIAGALLVVGAILAFTGVNFPLGIALIMAGAVGLASVAVLNWDAMPEEVQRVVDVVLKILGGALIAIGALLCATGHIPLGVAAIIAGIVVFAVSAEADNEDAMPEKIQRVVGRVVDILKKALLVIGIMLCATGHIPLGIAAIIAGITLFALTAETDDEESMPEKIRRVVDKVIGILRPALVVLGILLCATGHIPLGIAAIIAGIALFAVAAATDDEESMPEKVRRVVDKVVEILRPVLVVLGMILCATGHIPLGIAAIIAGAALFALGDATDDEGLTPEKVERVVSRILRIVGTTLTVLGMILCATGNIPLGVGFIIAGAASLAVSECALNEDLTPEKVQEVVNRILEIVGEALIVVGMILCVIGNIPLGVGFIIAGAVAWVVAQDIDWDFLVNKIKEVWDRIKQFWDDNIAPVFTAEFWEGVFKSIVNGLIGMVNSGLDAFGGFVNGIADGISDVLNWFDIDWSPFHVWMPHIPYLAQGAVIPPNREFMAVLGDQPHGNNIETPEALMRQVVREEVGAMMAELLMQTQGAAQPAGDVTLVLRVDSEELSRAVSRGNASRVRRGEAGMLALEFV